MPPQMGISRNSLSLYIYIYCYYINHYFDCQQSNQCHHGLPLPFVLLIIDRNIVQSFTITQLKLTLPNKELEDNSFHLT